MFLLNNYYSMKVGLESPDQIREWSYGEVTNENLFDSETGRPADGGILCERIFGTTANWECRCGKYKGIEHRGVVCEDCGVEVTHSKVRRERMGHIELVKPVLNVGYLSGLPSRVGILLDIDPVSIRKVIDCLSFIVIEPGDTKYKYKQIICDKEYSNVIRKIGSDSGFKAECGSSGIKKILSDINIKEELKQASIELQDAKGHEKQYLEEKIYLLHLFLRNNARPEWMVFDVIPVIPPDFRPVDKLKNNKIKISEISKKYMKVVYRNNRMKTLIELGAPEIIIRNENKYLQKAVDDLVNQYRIKIQSSLSCLPLNDSILDYEDIDI